MPPRRRRSAAAAADPGPPRPDRPVGLPARPVPGLHGGRHRQRRGLAPLRAASGRSAGPFVRTPDAGVDALDVGYILTSRKPLQKVKQHEDQGEPVPGPRRADRPGAQRPVLKGALAGGGQLSNIVGVLAGSPAALRAYARFRSELRHGTLPLDDPAADRPRGRRAPGQRVRARPRSSAPRARPASASTRSRWRASSTPATSARPRCCASCKGAARERRPAAAAPPRGGARGRLDRRADPRGGRPRGARLVRATSSPGPATSRSTARPRRPGWLQAAHEPGRRISGAALRWSVMVTGRGNRDRDRGQARALLLALPPRGRAGRQALDRRDPARPDRRAAALLRDHARWCPTSPTACSPSA